MKSDADIALLAQSPPYPWHIDKQNIVSGWSFDESSGRADDLYGSNDLTENNTPSYVASEIDSGSAADLEFSNSEYFNITDASQSGLDLGATGYMCCFVKLESLTGSDQNMFSKWRSSGDERSYNLQRKHSPQIFRMNANSDGTGSGGANADSATVATGISYFVEGYWTSSDVYVVVYGVSVSAAHTGGAFDNGQDFFIGAFDGPSAYLIVTGKL